MYISSCDGYSANIKNDDFEPLRAEITATLGLRVRRINRFIELALVGVARTAKGVSPETGIYLGSGRGDVEVTLDILQDICRDGHALRPMNFIHSVSNAACFYIAKSLNLHGLSQFSSSRYLSFEAVLHLALLDMQAGRVPAALVGTVDVVTTPLAHHRIRVEREHSDEDLAEASYWLQLDERKRDGETLAEIKHYAFSQDLETLASSLPRDRVDDSNTQLILGQFLSAEVQSAVQKTYELSPWTTQAACGYFDSQCGYLLKQWLESSAAGEQVLYIGGGPDRRFFSIFLQRL